MTTITIAKGDGIGPEIMTSVLSILKASKAPINFEEIQIGEQVYLSGKSSGIADETWDVIKKNRYFLKAPITTPQGGGYKSLNVTARKTLGLFANVRPCYTYHPFIDTKFPQMDVVIIRENEEDLYAGIEHQQTDEVVQCLKLITRPGCEKIIRYAFEYAKHYGRKKVTCLTKDNIMKQTDGLFRKVFNEIALEYPELTTDHLIIDIGSARLADTPENFDVIVTLNLYGDIISDIAAQISGSVGLAGSVNVGNNCMMFEAIHGSAPDIAGKNIANPTGLLNSAILMLQTMGLTSYAKTIENSLMKTIEDGFHTADIYQKDKSKALVSTTEFTDKIIENLGQIPKQLHSKIQDQGDSFKLPEYKRPAPKQKDFVGIDVFLHDSKHSPDEIAALLNQVTPESFKLNMISNRGVKVWPKGLEDTFCTDHWRCRFMVADSNSLKEWTQLISSLMTNNFDVIKTENLYHFDGVPAFSLGQGQ